jgi:hypothetical protein
MDLNKGNVEPSKIPAMLDVIIEVFRVFRASPGFNMEDENVISLL